MYEEFYGLKTRPFQLNPDYAFYFGSKQHGKAKAYLEYGLSLGQGFVVITGEIGAGKTTILNGLLQSLNEKHLAVGKLVTTQLGAEDTLRMVAAAFGVDALSHSKSRTLSLLEAFMTNEALQGRRCLLIVDEAQNLEPQAVEELRMLSNFQLESQALLQTFLIGQPEFRTTMQRPEMEQLRQRVVASCHLGPMDLEDTQQYVAYRLRCAGAVDKPAFTPLALTAIHAASQGIPRRINTLCDRLLLYGFLEGKHAFDLGDVEAVVTELEGEGAALSSSDTVDPVGDGAPLTTEALANHDQMERIEKILKRLESLGSESLMTQRALLQALNNAVRERET